MSPPAEEKISRTRKKKQALALQRIGEQLVGLSVDQLSTLGLPEELFEAVREAGSMKKHEARRRHMQYIGSLMRQCDGTAIESALQELSRQDDAEVRRFKQIEQWRDELVVGAAERLEWILAHFPAADRGHLSKLMARAGEPTGEKERRQAGRELFRYLKKISE